MAAAMSDRAPALTPPPKTTPKTHHPTPTKQSDPEVMAILEKVTSMFAPQVSAAQAAAAGQQPQQQ